MEEAYVERHAGQRARLRKHIKREPDRAPEMEADSDSFLDLVAVPLPLASEPSKPGDGPQAVQGQGPAMTCPIAGNHRMGTRKHLDGGR